MYVQTYRSATQRAIESGEITIADIGRMQSVRMGFILAYRAGQTNTDRWTLSEIAKHWNVTTERVRQIEAKAIGLIKFRKQWPVWNSEVVR